MRYYHISHLDENLSPHNAQGLIYNGVPNYVKSYGKFISDANSLANPKSDNFNIPSFIKILAGFKSR